MCTNGQDEAEHAEHQEGETRRDSDSQGVTAGWCDSSDEEVITESEYGDITN